MTTARSIQDCIESALHSLGVKDPSESADSNDTALGLEAVQDILSEWSSEKMMIPFTTWEAVTLVVAQASYEIGDNGSPDLDTIRPIDITQAFLRPSGSSYDYPVEIIKKAQYLGITNKSTSGTPDKIWYNPTVPNGLLYCYPVPDAADSLYICGLKSFDESIADDLSDDLITAAQIPREYYMALKWALIEELSFAYGSELTQAMFKRINESKRKILNLNFARRTNPAASEFIGSAGGYNILTD
jgi:hypothetical protein